MVWRAVRSRRRRPGDRRDLLPEVGAQLGPCVQRAADQTARSGLDDTRLTPADVCPATGPRADDQLAVHEVQANELGLRRAATAADAGADRLSRCLGVTCGGQAVAPSSRAASSRWAGMPQKREPGSAVFGQRLPDESSAAQR